ncbi:homocitrate synthase/isopropylmalate synthase family protein [Alienimonas chondri]|uniref:2-isopropylmalate synthase n=1 Tax=Alienimonas chondri TaxID=2681879 RepID=A0ABX1VNU8_9PLAN|nr:pyruvate carboxyltransferase [Alienimonas chondri]NNJ28036.1 2-isopropylmalate synthase [Alienimonas chondri]
MSSLSPRRWVESQVKKFVIGHHNRAGVVLFSDTTLRDGEQMPGATLEPADKLRIARALGEAGVHSLDAGFPAAGPADVEGIKRMCGEVPGVVLTALCRTLHGDIDLAAEALKKQPRIRKGVSLFCGTSPLHREHKLRKSKEEVLDLIADAVTYAADRFAVVSFAAEDATRTEPDYLVQCYQTAVECGASTCGLPDTVGVCTPETAAGWVRLLKENVSGIDNCLIAGHFHNDLGLAVANTLAAVQAGATVVQCTIGGLGERAGNASLEEVAVALELNQKQYGRTHKLDLSKLAPLGALVSELTGVPVSPMKPVYGANVWATEAGIHQDGFLKHPDTYLPYRPELVGGPPVHLVLGRHSGRGAVRARLEALGLPNDDATAARVVEGLKALPKGDPVTDDRVRGWASANGAE